jgi:hypothetical protein
MRVDNERIGCEQERVSVGAARAAVSADDLARPGRLSITTVTFASSICSPSRRARSVGHAASGADGTTSLIVLACDARHVRGQ